MRQVETPDKCQGCTFCNPDTIEFYEWVDQDPPGSPHLPKKFMTKAQIHSTHTFGEHHTTVGDDGIKYAVILHDCQAEPADEP